MPVLGWLLSFRCFSIFEREDEEMRLNKPLCNSCDFNNGKASLAL
jgi:hypothetical protein